MKSQGASVRRPYLDWLRVFIILMLIPFHTAMTFAPYEWYLRNNELNLATQALVMVQDQYHMELLFLIAGAATWFSLGIRSGRGYLTERLQRLVVPLIFGMLVLVPPCYYIAARQFEHYGGSFFDWYPTFILDRTLPFRAGFAAGALWFLWYLVFYTLGLMPFFLLIRRKFEHNLIPRLASFFEKRGALFILAIPTAIVQIYTKFALSRDFLLFYYVIFFVYGFFLFSEPRFQRGIVKSGPIALLGGAITMTLYMLLVFPVWWKAPLGSIYWPALKGEPGTLGHALRWTLCSFNSLFWIIGLLYLARKFLNFSNRFLEYGNDAVLPYYIIHSTPIAVIGYFIIQWDMAVLPKYAINVVTAFIATVGLYELVKRTNVTRFLLGIRLKKKRG